MKLSSIFVASFAVAIIYFSCHACGSPTDGKLREFTSFESYKTPDKHLRKYQSGAEYLSEQGISV